MKAVPGSQERLLDEILCLVCSDNGGADRCEPRSNRFESRHKLALRHRPDQPDIG